MKPVFMLLLLISSIIACNKKDSALTEVRNPNVQAPLINTPPVANAGADQFVFTPADSCLLTGSYSGRDIQTVLWRKISGPNTSFIANPNLLATKVQNLQKGTYAFELTVINSSLQKGKDTVTVTVAEIGNNAIVFEDLSWIFPWYASLEVRNFWSHVTPGTPMKIFVQRGFETTWHEVPPVSNSSNNNISYEYFVETRPDGAGMYNYGSLYVFYYGNNTNDKPKIKVNF